MNLDRANRNFMLLVGVALLPYVLLAIVGCGLLSVFALRISEHGLSFLTAGRGDLRPAAVVLAIVLFGSVRAVFAFVDQREATLQLARRFDDARLPVPQPLENAARSAGLSPGRLRYIDSDEPFSCAYGLGTPRVAISRALYEAAAPDELDAVMAHEAFHVRNRDPVKIVLARVLASAYFFLPALGGLRARYGAAIELAADRQAVRTCGTRSLAGALRHVVSAPGWEEFGTAAAIGGPDLLELRVEQLERGEEPAIARMPARSVVLTIVTLTVLAAVIVGTIVAVGGPSAVSRGMMSGRGGGMGMSGSETIASLVPWAFAGLIGLLAVRRARHARLHRA